MARIRSVHPALFSDEAWVSCSPFARILFIGLWTDADDQGVFEWRPLQIKLRLMAADNVSVADLLDELQSKGLVQGYEIAGKNYGAIKDFQKFQRPQKPRATFPLDASLEGFVTGKSDAPPDLFADQYDTGKRISNQMERRGEEDGIGVEGTRTRARKPEIPIPEGFPDAEAIADARAKVEEAGKDVDVEHEAQRFRGWHLSKDTRYRDWRQAWLVTWLSGAIRKAPLSAGSVHTLVPAQQQENWMREFLEAPHRWRHERGPRPDEPGCRISPQIMAKCGFTPPRRAGGAT